MSDHALQAGKVLAESFRVDTCTITRPGTSTFSSSTGDYSDSPTSIYTGSCRVAFSQPGSTLAGEVEQAQDSPTVWLPLSADAVLKGDLVTITASKLDTQLVGRVFRVTGSSVQTHVARRIVQVEVTL